MNNLNMTEGRPLPVIFRFMVPLLLGTVCQQLYTVADSAVVGRFVGATALGSVGMVSGVCNLLLALCVGLSGGVNIYASQCFGAGRADTLRAVVRNSIYVTIIVGAAMSLIGICLTEPVLHAMGTPAVNMRYARVYMRIVCGGMLVTAFYNTFSQLLRAVGDSATPLYAVMASSVVNVALDLLLVALFHAGVAGAAAATVASQILSVIWLYVRGLRRHESLMPSRSKVSSKVSKVSGHHQLQSNDWRIVKMICLLGIPLAIQNAMGSITGVIIQRAVNSFGSEMMSAYTVAGRVNELFLLPLSSLGVAIASFAVRIRVRVASTASQKVSANAFSWKCCIQPSVSR
ncbi:MAG: MATE family efflux transporter [Chordicoccus sp.]